MRLMSYIVKSARMKFVNIKVCMFVLLMVFSCWNLSEPVRRFAYDVDYPVSWCVFPFFWTNFSFLILFWFGIVYVNSDVPFLQHINMYQMIRTGRINWGIGQIGGIFLRSLFCTLFLVVVSVLSISPRIDWTLEWGKGLHTIAISNADVYYQFEYRILYDIMTVYSPVELFLIMISLCTLLIGFIGVWMFMISLLFNKICAVASAVVWTILPFFVINTHPMIRNIFARFVPTIWIQVCKVETADMGYYWLPSIGYMYGFLFVALSIMICVILYKIKHMEFNWDNQDL